MFFFLKITYNLLKPYVFLLSPNILILDLDSSMMEFPYLSSFICLCLLVFQSFKCCFLLLSCLCKQSFRRLPDASVFNFNTKRHSSCCIHWYHTINFISFVVMASWGTTGGLDITLTQSWTFNFSVFTMFLRKKR